MSSPNEALFESLAGPPSEPADDLVTWGRNRLRVMIGLPVLQLANVQFCGRCAGTIERDGQPVNGCMCSPAMKALLR